MPQTLRWRNWPLRDRPRRAGVAVLVLLAAGGATYLLTGRPSLALLAGGTVAVALWRLLIPVEFELSASGVQQRVFGRRRILPWRAIRRWEICDDGVLLLSHDDRSALAPMRGFYLPFSQHRDAIVAHVDCYLVGRPPADTRGPMPAEQGG